ncbi:MAG: cell wall hydrolase [Peptococcaceae bacterium]|nr:cell wall hydrolase [Candidatus Syntrophopropionicum ammoniitolerans]
MSPNYRKWGEYMGKWREILENKRIKGLITCLVPLLTALLIAGVITVKKIAVPREQQTISSVMEVQTTAREKVIPASRGVVAADRRDIQVLAQVIEGEAADEPYQGKVAVGAVIMNRCENPEFPNTIPGVISQVDAFESVSNGQYQRPLSEESMRAAVEALNGDDPSGGALYFWNPAKSTSNWVWSRPVIKRIGNHVFAG